MHCYYCVYYLHYTIRLFHLIFSSKAILLKTFWSLSIGGFLSTRGGGRQSPILSATYYFSSHWDFCSICGDFNADLSRRLLVPPSSACCSVFLSNSFSSSFKNEFLPLPTSSTTRWEPCLEHCQPGYIFDCLPPRFISS